MERKMCVYCRSAVRSWCLRSPLACRCGEQPWSGDGQRILITRDYMSVRVPE